jgi:inner membrane protein
VKSSTILNALPVKVMPGSRLTVPTLITHALTAAALGQLAEPEWRKQPQFWAAAVACSVLPDVDVIGFSLGVRYGDLWGHRGMTHSLLFSATVATFLTALFKNTGAVRWKPALIFFFLASASHGLLDALTDGGLGVAFFSPFVAERYFFPWTPIHVSPIGMIAFFSTRGMRVLWSEALWVWIPTLTLSAAIFAIRRRRRTG